MAGAPLRPTSAAATPTVASTPAHTRPGTSHPAAGRVCHHGRHPDTKVQSAARSPPVFAAAGPTGPRNRSLRRQPAGDDVKLDNGTHPRPGNGRRLRKTSLSCDTTRSSQGLQHPSGRQTTARRPSETRTTPRLRTVCRESSAAVQRSDIAEQGFHPVSWYLRRAAVSVATIPATPAWHAAA